MDGHSDPHAPARRGPEIPRPEVSRHTRARAPVRKGRSESKIQQRRSNASAGSVKATRMPIPAKVQGLARRPTTCLRSTRAYEAETKDRFAASRTHVAHLAGPRGSENP